MNIYFDAARSLLSSLRHPNDRRSGLRSVAPAHRHPNRNPSPPPAPGNRRAPGLRPPPPTRPHWGAVDLLTPDEPLHFAVCGCTGSGKSLEIRALIQSVLRGFNPDSDRRALIYDAKRDIYPFLHALGLGPVTFNLNPFDRRGFAWDLAADLQSVAEMDQFASIVIPANANEHNPYFTDAARILLRCTLVALHRLQPRAWTLRDVLLCSMHPDRLRALLRTDPQTDEVAENFFAAREFPSVMTTLETKMRPLTTVAALWHRAGRSVSLRQSWLERGSIVLLPFHPTYSYALEAVNQAIFRYLSDAMLAQPNSGTRRSWVFLDEVREAGKFDGMRKLLTQGREKGVCVVLGFQDIEGMRQVYGSEGAGELLGECNHKTFLRTDSPATAEWMASHINKALLRTRQVGQDKDGNTTTSESLKIDTTVLAADFLGIPVTSPEYGMKALHLSSRIPKPYWTHRSLGEVVSRLPPIPREIPGEAPRPASDQDLLPWDPSDGRRLGLPVSAPTGAPSASEPSRTPAAETPAATSRPAETGVKTEATVEADGASPQSAQASVTELLWATRRPRRSGGSSPPPKP